VFFSTTTKSDDCMDGRRKRNEEMMMNSGVGLDDAHGEVGYLIPPLWLDEKNPDLKNAKGGV
jgi:hypothetical protein